jgi:Zn-dependent protease/CBS domain-containing protein
VTGLSGDSVGSVFSNAFRIGSISGIAIRIDLSWFLIAALFALGFWGYFQEQYGHATPVAVVLAIIGALLFFGSVLAHELGHALEAKHRGVEVGGITLFLFGGVTETKFDVQRPFDEFALSAVGPYVSFVLAAVFGLVSTVAQRLDLAAVADVTGVLGWLNLVLGIFNLLPGAPLDGGRILRSIAWKVTGDRPRAIRIAARAGQALGGLIILLGLAQAFILGQVVFGLFHAFIGWFLYAAAGSEHRHTETQVLLEGRTVGSIVDGPSRPLPVDSMLDEIAETITRSPSDAHPVVDRGEVVGVVHYEDVVGVDRDRRRRTELREVTRPLRDVGTVSASTPLGDVIDAMERSRIVAVIDEGEVVGLLAKSDLERSLRRIRELHGDRSRPRRRDDGHLPGDEA